MGLTEQPRADRPVTDFDPNNPRDDADEVGAREPKPAVGDPAPNPGDATDQAGSGPGLTTVGGATDGMPGTGSGSPNG